MLKQKTKIIAHPHSGRLRSHEYTSYFSLAFLLMIVCLPLIVYTASAASPPPQAGSVSLSGIVPGKPPTAGAIITTPSDQQHFSATPITVSGTCPANTLVEIFKNNIFAGSAPCQSNGTFTLKIDLMIGKNTLSAQVFDALNQTGPKTATRTVFYDALPPQAAGTTDLSFAGPQLLLNTSAVFRGTFPGQDLSVPIDIIGGTAPYAVNIQWGDNSDKIVSRKDNTSFSVKHAYQQAGTYQITLQATDLQDRVAFLTVASIVNGQPPVASAASSGGVSGSSLAELLVLWPLFVGTFAVVVSFWLGEKRERRVLQIHGQLLPTEHKI